MLLIFMFGSVYIYIYIYVYITKLNRTIIVDAEDLDLVIPMYNFIEYSSNYSETTASLDFYSKDEATNFNDNIVNNNNLIFQV